MVIALNVETIWEPVVCWELIATTRSLVLYQDIDNSLYSRARQHTRMCETIVVWLSFITTPNSRAILCLSITKYGQPLIRAARKRKKFYDIFEVYHRSQWMELLLSISVMLHVPTSRTVERHLLFCASQSSNQIYRRRELNRFIPARLSIEIMV